MPDDAVQMIDGGDFGAGASIDGIGAFAEFDGAIDEVHIPCRDTGGLLDEGEGGLPFEEDLPRGVLGGDVADEDDDAVVGGTALNVEPEIEGVGVEVFEFGRDAIVHGTVDVFEEVASFGCGKFFPQVSSDEIAFDGEEFLGARIEEGKGVVAGEDDDGVGGGFEDLFELARGCVAAGFGLFSGGDVVGEDDDAVFVGTRRDFEPDIEWFGVVGLELGGDALVHSGAVVGGEGLLLVVGEPGPEIGADEVVGL